MLRVRGGGRGGVCRQRTDLRRGKKSCRWGAKRELGLRHGHGFRACPDSSHAGVSPMKQVLCLLLTAVLAGVFFWFTIFYPDGPKNTFSYVGTKTGKVFR